MTQEEVTQIIKAAIYDAEAAMPDGDDKQLTDWVLRNRLNSFSPEVHEALADEGLKEAIRERARILGVELRD
jgi:hypothetical protein